MLQEIDADLKNLSCWVEIDLDAIEHNHKTVKTLIKDGTKVLAVVKADAYGHGAEYIANLLKNDVDYFGVARIDEAVELRISGIKDAKILILGHTEKYYYPLLTKYSIIPTVYNYDEAVQIAECGVKNNKCVDVHIAVDTGMSRIGFELSDESVEIIKKISLLEGIRIDGIFSHFADADNGDNTNFTCLQLRRFRKFTESLRENGIDIPTRHLFNSAAITELDTEFDMVREGIYLYGIAPSDTVNKAKAEKFIPAMSMRCKVIHIHDIEPGTPVGYGCTFTSEKTMKIATVSIGYADGVPRLLSNKGHLLINGRKAKIVGNVCMDLLMCDITDIKGVEVGDTATVFGKDYDAEITAAEVADIAHTIPYEVICGISKRVPRIYYKDGKVIDFYFGTTHRTK